MVPIYTVFRFKAHFKLDQSVQNQISGTDNDFPAYDIQTSSSVIDIRVFWAEARNSQPKDLNVPVKKFKHLSNVVLAANKI